MPAGKLFDEFIANLGAKKIDLSADTFKAVLSLTAPSQSADDEYADITEIANGFGYTTGGVTLTSVTWAETGAGTGIWKFTCDPIQWTAAGGSIAAARYLSIYDDTSTNDKLVWFHDHGSSFTVPDTGIYKLTPGANGLFLATRA